jgi:2-amino-4-hydroxy-6-hydroxymethyldihydropteridine diphosphokinase
VSRIRGDSKRTSQCLVSFGSNLGTRESLIARAAAQIAESSLIDGFQASRLFETPAIGGPGGQEPFLNAVAAFETPASAREILLLLQEIETRLGRQRRRRWDARSIDLDVVLHGELVGGGTGLIVPHPRYTARQFVLQPACDVAPHFRDPRFGWTMEQLAAHVSAGVPSLALVGGDREIRQSLCQRLESEHNILTIAARPLAPRVSVVGNAPAVVGGGYRAGGIEAQEVVVSGDRPWVSAFVPHLPGLQSTAASSALVDGVTSMPNVPRLVARIQRMTAETRWPAPHQMWPAGWQWPEYRLEVDDLDWAVREAASALDSMRCPVRPVTVDGLWWQA